MKWQSVSTHSFWSLYAAHQVGDIINTASWAFPGRRTLTHRWPRSHWDRACVRLPCHGQHTAVFTVQPHASFIFISQVIAQFSSWECTALFARWRLYFSILLQTGFVVCLSKEGKFLLLQSIGSEQGRPNRTSHLQQCSSGVSLQALAQFVHFVQ